MDKNEQKEIMTVKLMEGTVIEAKISIETWLKFWVSGMIFVVIVFLISIYLFGALLSALV